MPKPPSTTVSLHRSLQRKSQFEKIPTPPTSTPLAGPSLEKLKLKALLNPCLTSEEATLHAHIQQCQASESDSGS